MESAGNLLTRGERGKHVHAVSVRKHVTRGEFGEVVTSCKRGKTCNDIIFIIYCQV